MSLKHLKVSKDEWRLLPTLAHFEVSGQPLKSIKDGPMTSKYSENGIKLLKLWNF